MTTDSNRNLAQDALNHKLLSLEPIHNTIIQHGWDFTETQSINKMTNNTASL